MCNDTSNNIILTNEVTVNLILKADTNKQIALLTYVQEFDKQSNNFQYINNIELIDNADFFVNNNRFENIISDSMKNNHLWNSDLPKLDSCYNYFSENKNILNEAINTLQIEVKNKTITGKTILPGDFSVSLNKRKLTWTSSSNAFLYRITVLYQNEENVQPFKQTTTDTTINLEIVDFIPGIYNIIVEAIDENLYNFTINDEFHSGLEGAYGVFGSVRIKQFSQNIE